MGKVIRFRVYGLPRPAGSKKAFVNPKTQRAIVVEDCKKSKTWRGDVKDAFRDLGDIDLLEGPLKVFVIFIMPRIKGHFRANGELKPNAPQFHQVRPDSTKLWRGTEDALTGLAWRDDGQVSIQTAAKIYGDKPGAHIEIREVTDDDLDYINTYSLQLKGG